MDSEEIKVKCKKCGRQAKTGDFVLDPDFKMMVCPLCIKEKRMREEVYSELAKKRGNEGVEEEELEKKPAGWDKEDEYLQRAYKRVIKDTVKVEKVDEEKVKYKCPKCDYQFIYDIARKTPAVCPYCGSDIFKFRF